MNQYTLKNIFCGGEFRLFIFVCMIFNVTEVIYAAKIRGASNSKVDSKIGVISLKDFDLLPDGNSFPFWDDQTKYSKVLHVAQKNQKASDDNPGTAERPFKTINAAAKLLQPGEKVIVHEGIYRECVRPLRGGTANNRMISYEAASGEKVGSKGIGNLETETRSQLRLENEWVCF